MLTPNCIMTLIHVIAVKTHPSMYNSSKAGPPIHYDISTIKCTEYDPCCLKFMCNQVMVIDKNSNDK